LVCDRVIELGLHCKRCRQEQQAQKEYSYFHSRISPVASRYATQTLGA
jgi:hypothetical protein